MNKIINFILTIILLGALAYVGYTIYQYLPAEKQILNIQTEAKLPEVNASSTVTQFVPNMRFAKSDLSYFFYPGCSQDKETRMKEAFSTISSQTGIITFTEKTTLQEADIKIFCSEVQKEVKPNQFIAGEGGPDEFLNLSLYPLIVSGEIYLYDTLYRDKCDYPLVELHELLHVFGFDHVNKKSSVLYPYYSCGQQLDSSIVNELIRIYSITPKAELHFVNASASKHGIYLDFKTPVENRGLIEAENVTIVLYSQGKEIANFDMGNISPGTTKSITIQNQILPSRSTSEIEFSTISNTQEYFSEDNQISAKL
ncbi:Matrixin [uncultured archaeon]|nr:Matrixin [uncultured archaeon]